MEDEPSRGLWFLAARDLTGDVVDALDEIYAVAAPDGDVGADEVSSDARALVLVTKGLAIELLSIAHRAGLGGTSIGWLAEIIEEWLADFFQPGGTVPGISDVIHPWWMSPGRVFWILESFSDEEATAVSAGIRKRWPHSETFRWNEAAVFYLCGEWHANKMLRDAIEAEPAASGAASALSRSLTEWLDARPEPSVGDFCATPGDGTSACDGDVLWDLRLPPRR